MDPAAAATSGSARSLNTLSVGLIANLGLYLIPNQAATRVARSRFLALAIVMFGVGGGLYIGSGLGPGPRDGLMTAIAGAGPPDLDRAHGRSSAACSSSGSLLGGDVGVGTVLLAFTIGPVTHAGLRRFHLPVRDDTPEVMGE